jgi:hypothetical protein
MLMMALTMKMLLRLFLLLLVMLMGRLEDCCVGIHHLESETRDKSQTVCLSPRLHLLPRLTSPLLAIFAIGVIVLSPLGMGLLRLTKIHHHYRDIAFVAIMTALFVFAGAIGALSVLSHSPDTQREVLSVPVLLLSALSTHPPLSSSSFFSFSSWLIRETSTSLNIEKTERSPLSMLLSLVSDIVFSRTIFPQV